MYRFTVWLYGPAAAFRIGSMVGDLDTVTALEAGGYSVFGMVKL